MAVSAEERNKPFAVECSNDPHVETAVIDERFRFFDEAMSFADEKAKKFRAVWASEIGVYESPEGQRKEGRLWFWWKPSAVDEYGEVFGRRTGWACDYTNYQTSYTPIGEVRT